MRCILPATVLLALIICGNARATVVSPADNNIQSVAGVVEYLDDTGSTVIQFTSSRADPGGGVDFSQSPYILTMNPIDLLTYDPTQGAAQILRLGNPPFYLSHASYGDWSVPNTFMTNNVLFGYGAFAAGSREGWRAPPPPTSAYYFGTARYFVIDDNGSVGGAAYESSSVVCIHIAWRAGLLTTFRIPNIAGPVPHTYAVDNGRVRLTGLPIVASDNNVVNLGLAHISFFGPGGNQATGTFSGKVTAPTTGLPRYVVGSFGATNVAPSTCS